MRGVAQPGGYQRDGDPRGTLFICTSSLPENKLANYLVPAVPLFSNRQPKGAAFENVFSFQERIEGLFAALCALLLPTFQVYALSQLLDRMHGQLTITFMVAACMTIILTIVYLVPIVMLASHVIHWWLYEKSSERIRASGRDFAHSSAAL
jgi:ABC-type multidrug transport system permease subunit